jgi:hypothetical protein
VKRASRFPYYYTAGRPARCRGARMKSRGRATGIRKLRIRPVCPQCRRALPVLLISITEGGFPGGTLHVQWPTTARCIFGCGEFSAEDLPEMNEALGAAGLKLD